MEKKEELTELHKRLLVTLLDGPKLFHMGRTPVVAIQAGWELANMGLVGISGDAISLTIKGIEVTSELTTKTK